MMTLFLIIFVPERVFQARQVSNLGSKSEDVYDHVFSASIPTATVTYLVNKREQATDKTNKLSITFLLSLEHFQRPMKTVNKEIYLGSRLAKVNSE